TKRHSREPAAPQQKKTQMAREGRKPGSVPRRSYPRRGDDHSSRTAVADGLKQHTQAPRTGRPQTLLYSALLRMGFTELPTSPPELVSSYLTLSPLPAWSGRSSLCGTFPGVAPGPR